MRLFPAQALFLFGGCFDDQGSAQALHSNVSRFSLVYVNTLLIQQVLSDPEWMQKMGPDELRPLTPLIYAHVNLYGVFRLNMAERLPY